MLLQKLLAELFDQVTDMIMTTVKTRGTKGAVRLLCISIIDLFVDILKASILG